MPRLAAELLDQLIDREVAHLDERVAEPAVVGVRARRRLLVLLLRDHAAADEKRAERLVTWRVGADRVAVDEIDRLGNLAAPQREAAGRELLVEIEEHRRQRPHRELPGARLHLCESYHCAT